MMERGLQNKKAILFSITVNFGIILFYQKSTRIAADEMSLRDASACRQAAIAAHRSQEGR